jgi:hypothetical protein
MPDLTEAPASPPATNAFLAYMSNVGDDIDRRQQAARQTLAEWHQLAALADVVVPDSPAALIPADAWQACAEPAPEPTRARMAHRLLLAGVAIAGAGVLAWLLTRRKP